MKYFYDTEFLEGTQDKRFLGIKYGKTKPTIDFISIGIVSEDGREYYGISKDFNLKQAWNRYDRAEQTIFEKRNGFEGKKVYWIRDNVLLPIHYKLAMKEGKWDESIMGFEEWKKFITNKEQGCYSDRHFKTFERLLNKYGKSNLQIANDICEFFYSFGEDNLDSLSPLTAAQIYGPSDKSLHPELYGYYSAYDHVVFCWLFGRMIDLPKGFPMYSKDMKQIFDSKLENKTGSTYISVEGSSTAKSIIWGNLSFEEKIEEVKTWKEYPKNENCHDALSDAKWHKNLYEFINKYL